MPKTVIAALAASALLLAACGSDSDGAADGPQSELVTMLTESLDDAGVAYDADCLEDKIAQLTDEDAEAIVAAGVEGDPDVSDEADAIGDSIGDCLELGS